MGLSFKTMAENLHRFDRLCVEKDIQDAVMTEELITEWISPRQGERESTRSVRITALKGFVNYLNSRGAEIKWPNIHRSWKEQTQFVPYIFTSDEVKRIIEVADSQRTPAHSSQFHLIFPAILRVLYGTGLRISEALDLRCEDVDLVNGHLTVWNSKYDNSRRLPISLSLRDELLRYEHRLKRPSGSIYFFPNSKGVPYSQRTVYDKFRDVLWQSGISHGCGRKGPRVHDFRHTFAVHSLMKCADSDIDTYTFLPILATYLGHKKVSTTEKYLRLTSESYPAFLLKATTLSNTIIPEVKDYEDRTVPLSDKTAHLIVHFLKKENLQAPEYRCQLLFTNPQGNSLTRAGVSYILKKYSDQVRTANPELLPEVVTPHCVRHSKAMHLLQAGVPLIYIRDFLGHSQIRTTEIYAKADSKAKRSALENAYPELMAGISASLPSHSWKDDIDLIQWLDNLC